MFIPGTAFRRTRFRGAALTNPDKKSILAYGELYFPRRAGIFDLARYGRQPRGILLLTYDDEKI
jgi:hypothetical protein